MVIADSPRSPLSSGSRGSAALSRRTLLRGGLTAFALAVAPSATRLTTLPAQAAGPGSAFAAGYRTNQSENVTAATNAAVRALDGMTGLWQTGPTWDTGVPLDLEVLRANIRHCVEVTRARTDAEAARAFVHDRQDQSYAVIAGLGPVLTPAYLAASLAVTSITEAPSTTPPEKVSDEVPAGAAPGSATGAGSPDSALGAVVALERTLRGDLSSSNPSKAAYSYPRPWRQTVDNRVVDTGRVDDLGFPVYSSEVVVVPALLRQRGDEPESDGGFPSGHTNALFLAALALAQAVPERYQELVTRAHDLGDTRIVAGMHSPLDVIGGRILATGLAASILSDPANAGVVGAARAQALAVLSAATGTPGDDLRAAAHASASAEDDDAYADKDANRAIVARTATYDLPRRGARDVPMVVPAGAEVLLATRQPYLSGDQRREVLRTTALGSGHPLLDGSEAWGRLDLFTAADGPGALSGAWRVDLDAAAGGFAASDTWANDIGGDGSLAKAGSGSLTLAGEGSFSGGVTVEGGALVAAHTAALGAGDVRVVGGAVLGADLGATGGEPVCVQGALLLDGGAELLLRVTGADRLHEGCVLPVLRAGRVEGSFAAVRVEVAGAGAQGWTATAAPTSHAHDGVDVVLHRP